MNPMMTDVRPDPDSLLAQVTRDEKKIHRGRLKIFFGASAGVGKTYAMLMAAAQLREQGVDVVVGLVETHGRIETASLLKDLEQLAPKQMKHRDTTLREFDLDAGLVRRPTVLLVDELAHTNAPGSRHPKRWQDVEELLSAGINVYSTVNVQHLESLNDIVGGITGIRVWETIPDRVFDSADEVVLVDLPPDDLLQRLKEGKIYLPEQAQRAIENFFRKGNLIALRELALRRTADRVDDQMRSYRQDHVFSRLLQTREALLACIGPTDNVEKTIRTAHRLAAALDGRWHAVYVETPALQRLPEEKRRAILQALKFAQDLGAVTATLPAHDAPEAIIDFARKTDLTTIVIGRPSKRAYLQGWRKSFAQRVAKLAPDLEIVIVPEETKQGSRALPPPLPMDADDPRRTLKWRGYFGAWGLCAITTLVAWPLRPYFDLANIVMLFLLAVVGVAMQWGRGPAVMAAIVNVAAFDFFFVSPTFTFAVHDVQYLLTFFVMLMVGLITGQLTANFRYQASVAGHREERARALYEMARELSSALTQERVCEIADRFVESSFRAKVVVLLPDEHERLHVAEYETPNQPASDLNIAQWSFDRSEPAGIATDTLPASPMLYLPLKAPVRNRGVMVVEPANARFLMIPEQRRQLETFATLTAIALERVHFVTVARDTLLKMESERLRNSLLSALSHDLRTPITSLVGLAESLKSSESTLTDIQSGIVSAMHEQAVRMGQLVNNLLDMARLESGDVRLRKEWQSIEDLIGGAIKARRDMLANHIIKANLPDLPLVHCDATLIERVLVNLLENAAKYTPAGTSISIAANIKPDMLEMSISDEGPGLPRGQEQNIFEKFVRGQKESGVPGVGLGLAICRAIMEAHEGSIEAANIPGGGARFTFALPLGDPPAPDETVS
jgi:two-component system, OmpR family, sensor histidine kinase KdpD